MMVIWLVVTGTWLDYFSIYWEFPSIPSDEFHHFSEGLAATTNHFFWYWYFAVWFSADGPPKDQNNILIGHSFFR